MMGRVLVWCAGASPSLLSRCPDGESIRQQIIGTFVLLTGTLALLTSFYALYSISDWFLGPLVAMGGSILWASMIFTLDRFIVSTMRVVRDNGNVYRIPLVQILPRLILAASIGMAVGVPLELYIFKFEISHELQSNYHIQKLREIQEAELNTSRLQQKVKDDCQVDERNLQVIDQQYQRYGDEINRTILGDDGTGKTCGPVCKDLQRRQKLNYDVERPAAAARLSACKSGNGTPAASALSATMAENARWAVIVEQASIDMLAKPSFLNQYTALHTIAKNPESHANAAIVFVPMLLVFFEVVPVLAKFLAGASTYELLAMQEKLLAIASTEREGVVTANAASILKIEYDRKLQLANFESTTFTDLSSTVHDRFKKAVIERVDHRLHEWEQSTKIEDDVAQLEQMFSMTLRQRFGGVMGSLAGVPAEATHSAGPRQREGRTPHAMPERTGERGETVASAPIEQEAVSQKAERVAPASTSDSAPRAARPSAPPAGGEAGAAAPPRENANVATATAWATYVRKLAESCATHTADLLANVFSSSLALVGGLPISVLGIHSQEGLTGPESLTLLAIAVTVLMVGRAWALRRANGLSS